MEADMDPKNEEPVLKQVTEISVPPSHVKVVEPKPKKQRSEAQQKVLEKCREARQRTLKPNV